MSEYQYYEFQAVDRPLTEDEMREVGAYSSRAEITPTRFVNEYSWGDFKGRPHQWMERWYDAFLYLANRGSRQLMFRLPASVLDLETAKRYCTGESASAWAHGDFILLSFRSEDEDGEDGWVEGEGWLDSILPLRAEIAGGDHRALYLAWLLCAQAWDADDDEPALLEPPVPPGLATLSPALRAFRDFLRIDPDLVQAGAERSPALPAAPDDEEVRRWITALPEQAKVDLLMRVAAGRERQVRMEVARGVHAARPASVPVNDEPRTAQELLDAADHIAEERRRAEAEAAARERERRDRAAAAARQKHLDALAGREEELWARVDELIVSKKPSFYDQAVSLLADLRDLAARDGGDAAFRERIGDLRERHARKPSFLQRLRRVLR